MAQWDVSVGLASHMRQIPVRDARQSQLGGGWGHLPFRPHELNQSCTLSVCCTAHTVMCVSYRSWFRHLQQNLELLLPWSFRGTSPTLTLEATEQSCKLQLVDCIPVLCWITMSSNAAWSHCNALWVLTHTHTHTRTPQFWILLAHFDLVSFLIFFSPVSIDFLLKVSSGSPRFS